MANGCEAVPLFVSGAVAARGIDRSARAGRRRAREATRGEWNTGSPSLGSVGDAGEVVGVCTHPAHLCV